MSTQFGWTDYGKAQLLKAATSGEKLTISAIRIGDGPVTTSGIGGNAVHTIVLTPADVFISSSNPNMLIVRGAIPVSEGGFKIGSMELRDAGGAIAYSSGTGDNKPAGGSGIQQEYTILFSLVVDDAAAINITGGIFDGGGGNCLPLAGGVMDAGAEIKISNAGLTGPGGGTVTINVSKVESGYGSGQVSRAAAFENGYLVLNSNSGYGNALLRMFPARYSVSGRPFLMVQEYDVSTNTWIDAGTIGISGT